MIKIKTCSPSNDQVVPVSIQGNPIALIVDVPGQWIRSNANALKNDQIVLPTTPGIKASWLPKSVTPNLLVGRSINLKKVLFSTTISFLDFFGRVYKMIQRLVLENANLERQVVPVDNSSNCVTTSHNVSVTEFFLYFSSFWLFFCGTNLSTTKSKSWSDPSHSPNSSVHSTSRLESNFTIRMFWSS